MVFGALEVGCVPKMFKDKNAIENTMLYYLHF